MFWLRYYKVVQSLYKKPTPGCKSGYFCPKNTFLQLKHIQRIYPTFNFLHENSPNYLCHFWNHMPFFTTQPLYISKWKFSDLLLLALKLTKFLISFLEPRVSFFSNFVLLSSVMRNNASVVFHLNICMLWANGSNQSANFQAWLFAWKLIIFLMSFFKSQISFLLNFASPFSVMMHNSSEIF